MTAAETAEALAKLSKKQAEVVALLLDRYTVPEIAKLLHKAESTIRNQLATAYKKLGVSSQAELIQLLRPRRAGLLGQLRTTSTVRHVQDQAGELPRPGPILTVAFTLADGELFGTVDAQVTHAADLGWDTELTCVYLHDLIRQLEGTPL